MRLFIACFALSILALGAAAQDRKEVKSFALKPPAYSIAPSVKHAQKRKDKAIQWYKKHLGTEKLK